MRYPSSYTSSAFIAFAIIVLGIVTAQQGFAWTNPTANPPASTSVITTSGGNLGVGVVTPLVKLHVNGSVRGDQAGALRIDSGNGTLDVGAMNASYAHFQTDRPNFYFNKSVSVDGALSNYAGRYYLAQSGISYLNGGAVGIGTTSPDANYKITTTGGGIKAENSSATQPAGYFNNAGGGSAVIIGTGGITLGGVNKTSWPATGLGGSGTTNYLSKWTAGSTLGNSVIFDDGTNVGINTTGPVTKLEVKGGHGDTKARLYSTGNGSTLDASLDMWASEPGVTYDGSGIGNNINGSPYYGRRNSGLGQSYVRFYGGDIYLATGSGEAANSITIKSNGAVGVGTSAPQFKFDVREDGTGSTWRRMGFTNSSSDRALFLGTYNGNGGVFSHNFALNGWMPLYVNTTNGSSDGGNVIMAGSGNVGIGTATPDANYKITTTGGGIKAENSSATQPAGYFNNAGGGPAITAGTGGITLGGVNKTSWPATGLGGSGTANYLAKFTAGTTMGNSSVYDAGTNVGIGTTDPAAQMAGTQGIGIYKNAYPAVGFKNDTSSWLLYGNGATFRLWNVSAGEVMAVNTSGNVGFGTTAPDANYRITTSGGGIKAENSSATQPAGYFSNAGGGPAITVGTGGITLGGVNRTAWPSGADNLGNHTATAALNMSGNDISALRNLTISGTMAPASAGTDSGLIGDRAYQFGYQEGGAWAHPYPDLIFGYHTGMKLGGYYGYGGTRFYNDHPSRAGATEIFSVGNGDNHVRIANNLYVTGAITAGAGGITLGGVNKTSWPSGTDDTKVLKAGDTMTGNLNFGSVGLGSVGVYDPTKTQAVWSMGPAYVLPAGGGTTSYGTLYGLGWSYEPDYVTAGNNPQSKAGLSHQLLVMQNGVTKTAIGTGIWTSGNLSFATANPYINSSSYFIAPGGAYFNGGTVYAEAAIQARGGIHDDNHANLSILGGTSGNTTFSGNITTTGTVSASAVYNPTYAP